MVIGEGESYDIINSEISMTSDHIGSEMVVLTVLCVLSIFIFPAVQGPYSAVNGPATAFQASRAATRVRMAMVQSALSSLGSRLVSPLVVLSWVAAPDADFQAFSLPGSSTILRC
jgi:hypothetical protein